MSYIEITNPKTKVTKQQKINLNLLEKYEQRAAVQWLKLNKILFYPVANGRKASVVERMELKRLGVLAGVPDLVIPLPRGTFHGFYAELKRRQGGKVSESQQFWLDALTAEGYYCCVPKGCDEFIEHVTKYLKL